MDSLHNTSLQGETDELRAALKAAIGDHLDAMDAGARALGEIAFDAPTPGDEAPTFTLPDGEGDPRSLNKFLACGDVVLIFYRGAWCPYCNLQLRAFQKRLDDFNRAGVAIVAVSPQTRDRTAEFVSEKELGFVVLSDVGNVVARSYGLVYQLGATTIEGFRQAGIDLEVINQDPRWELPAAATFLIRQDGRIALASVAGDYRWRIGPDEVLAALRTGA